MGACERPERCQPSPLRKKYLTKSIPGMKHYVLRNEGCFVLRILDQWSSVGKCLVRMIWYHTNDGLQNIGKNGKKLFLAD